MDGILKCKCARRERGYASWRFPSIIVGGAAAIPRWREVSSEPFGPARASSRPLREFPSRRAGARAIIVCQVEVRLRAKFRSFPRKRAYRSKIWVPATGSPRREHRGVPLAGTSAREWTTARRGGTSISGAIDHAATLFPISPFRASRRVIDVSGDGSNNRGRPVTLARDEAVAAGIGINGLPILALEPDLDRYYYDSVIGGPGAFVVAAQNYETFADAILKKLIIEIAAND